MPRSASPSSTSRSSSVIPAVRSTTWLKRYAAVSANITRRVRPNRVPGSKRKIGNAASNAMRRRTSTVGRVPTNAVSSNAMRNAADSGREKIRSAGAASASLPSETRVRSHSNAATMTSSSSPNTASCTPESRANWTIERAVFRNACLACAPTDAALGSANAFQSGGLCRSHNCLRWSARCISSALISASTQSWVSATFPCSASNSSRRAFAFPSVARMAASARSILSVSGAGSCCAAAESRVSSHCCRRLASLVSAVSSSATKPASVRCHVWSRSFQELH